MADRLAGESRLALQGVDIPQRIDAALDGKIIRVNRAAAGRLARMRLDERAAVVKPDGLLIGAGRQRVADVRMRQEYSALRTWAS